LEKGFSVITGETGAGKSILLGAIGLTLGQRADSSAIMDKTKKCIVEIEYNIAGYALKEWFDENDLDYSEQVMVRRELTAHKMHPIYRSDIQDVPTTKTDVGNGYLSYKYRNLSTTYYLPRKGK